MAPRAAVLLTPSYQPPTFLESAANPFPCHTSKRSPVTLIIATLPKTPSRKSFVCHTCEATPGWVFGRHRGVQTLGLPDKTNREFTQIALTKKSQLFASRALAGLWRLAVWRIKLGIVPERSRRRLHFSLAHPTMHC